LRSWRSPEVNRRMKAPNNRLLTDAYLAALRASPGAAKPGR